MSVQCHFRRGAAFGSGAENHRSNSDSRRPELIEVVSYPFCAQERTSSDPEKLTVQLDLADHFKRRIAEDSTAQQVDLKQN
jgi:hypothetical protein